MDSFSCDARGYESALGHMGGICVFSRSSELAVNHGIFFGGRCIESPRIGTLCMDDSVYPASRFCFHFCVHTPRPIVANLGRSATKPGIPRSPASNLHGRWFLG